MIMAMKAAIMMRKSGTAATKELTIKEMAKNKNRYALHVDKLCLLNFSLYSIY